MSRVNVHIGRVVVDGETNPQAITRAIRAELGARLTAEGGLPTRSAEIPRISVSAPSEPGGDALGRAAARAIHGGAKR